jgi:hypothetical protein
MVVYQIFKALNRCNTESRIDMVLSHKERFSPSKDLLPAVDESSFRNETDLEISFR